jgi:hypothetical protein
MAAFFNNTTQGDYGNIKDTPPIITVPSVEEQSRVDVLRRELEARESRPKSAASLLRVESSTSG